MTEEERRLFTEILAELRDIRRTMLYMVALSAALLAAHGLPLVTGG